MSNTGRSQTLTRTRRLALLGVALLVVTGLLGLASARAWLSNGPERARAPQDFPASVALPDVQLLSGSGAAMSLTDVHGSVFLLFFGYTSCPDFCPLTLGTFADVKQQLGAQAEQVRFVFVSVDGARDTPAVVAEYVARFDADFIALTGQSDGVLRLGEPLGLWFEAQPSNGKLAYTVDHTTDIYLFDINGTPVRSYPFDTPPEVLVADLRTLIDSS